MPRKVAEPKLMIHPELYDEFPHTVLLRHGAEPLDKRAGHHYGMKEGGNRVFPNYKAAKAEVARITEVFNKKRIVGLHPRQKIAHILVMCAAYPTGDAQQYIREKISLKR